MTLHLLSELSLIGVSVFLPLRSRLKCSALVAKDDLVVFRADFDLRSTVAVEEFDDITQRNNLELPRGLERVFGLRK